MVSKVLTKDKPGLCGNPLSKKCENSEALPPLPSTVDDGLSWFSDGGHLKGEERSWEDSEIEFHMCHFVLYISKGFLHLQLIVLNAKVSQDK